MSQIIASTQFIAQPDSVARPTSSLRRASATAMVVGPLLLFVGSAIHPEQSEDATTQLSVIRADSGRWLGTHLLLVLGAGIFVAATAALFRRLRVAAPRSTAIATAVGSAGSLGLFGLFATEGIAGWAVSRAGASADLAAAYDQLEPVAIAFGMIGLLLAVALIAAGVMFWRTGLAARWQSVGLVAGGLLLTIGMVGNIDVSGFAGMVLLVVSMCGLAHSEFTAGR